MSWPNFRDIFRFISENSLSVDWSIVILPLCQNNSPGPRFFVYVIRSSIDSTTSATVRYSRMPLHTRIILRTCDDGGKKMIHFTEEKWFCKSPPSLHSHALWLNSDNAAYWHSSLFVLRHCCFMWTAGVTTPLQRAFPELHLKTQRRHWLMTPAESWWRLHTAPGHPPGDVCTQRAELQLFLFYTPSLRG